MKWQCFWRYKGRRFKEANRDKKGFKYILVKGQWLRVFLELYTFYQRLSSPPIVPKSFEDDPRKELCSEI